MKKFNLKEIIDSKTIKKNSIESPNQTSDPPLKYSPKLIQQLLAKFKFKSKHPLKKPIATESVNTKKAKVKIDVLAKSKIDLLNLSGVLPTVAILEVKKLREMPTEIYLNANSKQKLVNVLILDDDLIENTILDKTIDHIAKNVKYGLFVQRIATNLRSFGREGSLFNLNHPLSFNYGTPNQQIILLANIETLKTLATDFNISDPNPLKFKIGHLYIPDDKDGSLDNWVDPKTKAYSIDELPQILKNTADSQYHTDDMDLFDFDSNNDSELQAILANL